MPPKKPGKPLWQIALFGATLALILFILFGFPVGADRQNTIVIGNADFQQRLAAWQRTWQRMPTHEEAQQMMQQHTREEVLYREAIKRGIDKNNQTVRRALVTQMQMLAQSQGTGDDLSDEAVEAFYALRAEQYRRPPEITFRQVFFSPDRRGGSAESDAQLQLAELRADTYTPEAIRELGDPTMLPFTNRDKTPEQVARDFGNAFSEAVFDLAAGQWHGPVPSGFGLHLVQVQALKPGYVPPLEEVARQVVADMQYEARQAAEEQFYTELLRQYDILYRGEVKKLMESQ